jgi:hypothetical protein
MLEPAVFGRAERRIRAATPGMVTVMMGCRRSVQRTSSRPVHPHWVNFLQAPAEFSWSGLVVSVGGSREIRRMCRQLFVRSVSCGVQPQRRKRPSNAEVISTRWGADGDSLPSYSISNG